MKMGACLPLNIRMTLEYVIIPIIRIEGYSQIFLPIDSNLNF